jgi:radical SAM superfamily enzyme YgiQ (UPF0313 family)
MNNIMLISFYNQKSLGLRYLENALSAHGYNVKTIFFKKFNSVNPPEVADEEMTLLKNLIADFKPFVIGLSAMVSLYMETVEKVNSLIKANFDIPVVWGGVYATMFPESCAQKADFVIRGEGEEAMVELAGIIKSGAGGYSAVKNLVYRRNGLIVMNEIRDLIVELDKYGVPSVGGDKCLIEGRAVTDGDPQLRALSYELTASRGCPFACSYCCAINLRRLSANKGRYVRFREVDSVMEELLCAKAKIKNLKVIHFWDEIFCDDDAWVDRFTERYKKEIGLPFEIWGHPLKCDDDLIRKLKAAGLYKVVMGIQSGSPYIRKEIFNRPESQEDILNSGEVLSRNKVPQVIYDFMLRHPFETRETIKETYELAAKLARPFQLQLHGLNFLPGTDIVQKALDMGVVSPDDMRRQMNASIKEQYKMYWELETADEEINFWYNLTYLTQFPVLRGKAGRLAEGGAIPENIETAKKLCKIGPTLERLRYYYKKGMIVVKGSITPR